MTLYHHIEPIQRVVQNRRQVLGYLYESEFVLPAFSEDLSAAGCQPSYPVMTVFSKVKYSCYGICFQKNVIVFEPLCVWPDLPRRGCVGDSRQRTGASTGLTSSEHLDVSYEHFDVSFVLGTSFEIS